MAKALIVYATRTGETKRIGELIAEGIRFSGHEAVTKKVNEIKNENDLQGFDAVVLGSATYHGDMIQSMKTLLFMAEKAELEDKVGGAFGSFGWNRSLPAKGNKFENVMEEEMIKLSEMIDDIIDRKKRYPKLAPSNKWEASSFNTMA